MELSNANQPNGFTRVMTMTLDRSSINLATAVLKRFEFFTPLLRKLKRIGIYVNGGIR
jgi:hypothetical protein